MRYSIDLFDAAGADKGSADSPSDGADARLDRTLTAGGTFVVRVRLFSYSFQMSGESATVPPVYTTPYTLRVEQ